ncbi:MAG: hypothetical protein QOE54_7256 [Streptosporangiaceae bacterium]|jgi:hypothetical protein|nr:hypothetical protein [Streptosporangiaceae bacterium]MDX6434890.1 hypothetical protein [Streptosporangiaceae bacterium]
MRMPDNEVDPAGNTQQFRAFVQKGERGSAQPQGTNTKLIIGVVAAIVVVVIVAAVFFLV